MTGATGRPAVGAVFVALAVLLAACGGGAAPSPTPAPKADAKPTEAPKPAGSPASGSPAPAPPAVGSPTASPAAVAASPAAGASPAASPAASPGASPSPAALGPSVSGEVDSIDGRNLSVVTNTGLRRVRAPENVTVLIEGPGSPEDLKPGVLVGVTGRPDGTAVVVRLFPPGITPKPSQFPMGGAQTGNVMTNATIKSFDGRNLTVDLGGQDTTLTFPPEAEVVKPVPSTFAEIQPGKRIVAFGVPEGDVLVAQTITILTQPPVVPR